MRRDMKRLAGKLAMGMIAVTRPPHRGRLFGLAVLAACGVLAATVVVNAAFGAGSSTGTTSTTSTTGTTGTSTTTTTTGTGLPAPYNKPPWLLCDDYVRPFGTLSRSRVHSLTIYIQCAGLAKQGYIQLVKLPNGWSFIRSGSSEYTVTANSRGKRYYWERHYPKLVKGRLTWYENDLTTWRYRKRVTWVVQIHIRLSRTAPIGKGTFIFNMYVQNGSQSKNFPGESDFVRISK